MKSIIDIFWRAIQHLFLLLYRLALWSYGAGIRAAAFFSKKARLWTSGRAQWPSVQAGLISAQKDNSRPLLWMHCASLGEFEQGRPVLEKLKRLHPDWQILLSFFSPSGYEIRKNYAGADFIVYLPLDSPSNARAFVQLWQPQLVIFVKYEFWYYYFKVLHQQKIPVLIIAALFRANQIFFKWYGGAFRELLGWVEHLFLQNQASADLLAGIGHQHYTICGDPRVDRVVDIAQQARAFPLVEQFIGQQPAFIAGSTWPEDEAILLPFFNEGWPQEWKIILAPHKINHTQINRFQQKLKHSAIRYSGLKAGQAHTAQVLIIDNIGMLSALYQYGRIAYIGGAFRTGLHNTLEPMAFGLPIIFGPKYSKFEEANYLVQHGGGWAIDELSGLKKVFGHLADEAHYRQAAQQVEKYISDNQGASTAIMAYFSKREKHYRK
jgi:3-deoxy-D-manno-octulosonic-acid transferase